MGTTLAGSVKITLRESWDDYPLIPVRRPVRSFFPPYQERFTLRIGETDIQTYVTGRKTDTEIVEGDPEAGTHLRTRMGDIAQSHPEISSGDEIIIKQLTTREYEIIDW
ncbi:MULTISPECIES: hypothetical protein [Haloarcula]|uniref:hypothetical protein n=1 Tax=Haloarcula TaxID=2237 RepID=UPI0023E7FFEC|nr:hypothetical protein [Halomicroarcula sp. SHR3]